MSVHRRKLPAESPRLSLRVAPAVGLLLAVSAVAAAAAEMPPEALADAAMQGDMAAVRTRLREGADPNALGAFATPALLWTVRVGDSETTAALLDAGADPNLQNAYGVAPLHLAIEQRDLAIVERLIEAGADVGHPDRTGATPLHLAAATGEASLVERLLAAGAAVDVAEPEYEQTPLHVAARTGSRAVAAVLIAHGADVNARAVAGSTPRMRLPEENRGSKGVGIVRGGWPARGMRYPTPGAKTPLLYATRVGDAELVGMLIDAGAKLELADADGVTPLLNAIVNASVAAAGRVGEHLRAAHDLIAAGADVNASDWYGQTPLWAAVDVRNLDKTGAAPGNGMDREAVLGLIRSLLAAGADPNARTREYPPERRFITRLGSLSWVDFTGQTPFLRAALAGDVTVMQLLLDHGADPNLPTYGGTTPLMAAAGINWVVNQTYDEGPDALLAAVELARTLGNDVDAENSMGLRAVHGAANRGSDAIIEFLARHGANLAAADAEGRTPLDWAAGVFLATHPPVSKPSTIALLERLLEARPTGVTPRSGSAR